MIEHDIWFSTLKLKNSIKIRLLDNLKTTENILNYARKGSFIFSEFKDEGRIKNYIKNSYNENLVKGIKAAVYEKDIKTTVINHSNYPEKLKYYEDSPSVLYYRGDISKVNKNKSVAIIGSRNCSSYGKSIATSIAKELSIRGINIISGLARGIDAASQESCIKNQGFTCGILGCGVDIVYPKENARLFNEVYKYGCVLSEFVPGTKPYHFNFPQRNRLISGMSDLVIIVEAGIKSGSLITAGLALDQGKDVMAVPGSVFSESSRGANRLLHDGAHVFTEMNDIYELLKINYNIVNVCQTTKTTDIKDNLLSIIKDKPLHIDEIINITHIDIKQLYELLFELQLDNQILSLSGNYYIKVANN